MLGVVNPKHRRVLCSQDILASDDSPELPIAQAAKFRGAIGSLLYVSPERPDAQFAIACLARSMSRPTKKAWSQLYALAEYLWHTRHYELTLKWTYPGRSMLDERLLSAAEVTQKQHDMFNEPMLVEVLTDSDWAGAADRISTSSCHVFVNGNLACAFVRKQGCISLSSCEAELVASVSGASEALYIAHVIRTAGSCKTRVVLRLDSSSARSLLFKQGVSRVRHLDTKLLWIQDYSRRKIIEPRAINTIQNSSDLGTKPLTSQGIAFLMSKIGYNAAVNDVRVIKNTAQARLIKKTVAAILALTLMEPSNALSPNTVQEDNDNFGDFYLVFVTSHPYSILSVFVTFILVIGWTLWTRTSSTTPSTTSSSASSTSAPGDQRGGDHRADQHGDRHRADQHGDRHRADQHGDRHRADQHGDRHRADQHGDLHGADQHGDRHGADHRGYHHGADHRGNHRGADHREDNMEQINVHPIYLFFGQICAAVQGQVEAIIVPDAATFIAQLTLCPTRASSIFAVHLHHAKCVFLKYFQVQLK